MILLLKILIKFGKMSSSSTSRKDQKYLDGNDLALAHLRHLRFCLTMKLLRLHELYELLAYFIIKLHKKGQRHIIKACFPVLCKLKK